MRLPALWSSLDNVIELLRATDDEGRLVSPIIVRDRGSTVLGAIARTRLTNERIVTTCVHKSRKGCFVTLRVAYALFVVGNINNHRSAKVLIPVFGLRAP
jgi:hypothetical protein